MHPGGGIWSVIRLEWAHLSRKLFGAQLQTEAHWNPKSQASSVNWSCYREYKESTHLITTKHYHENSRFQRKMRYFTLIIEATSDELDIWNISGKQISTHTYMYSHALFPVNYWPGEPRSADDRKMSPVINIFFVCKYFVYSLSQQWGPVVWCDNACSVTNYNSGAKNTLNHFPW